jgi:hypothetical protein
MTLDDILACLERLPERQKQKVEADALKATARRYFVPNIGPQTLAYLSEADEVFYGGGAGGGKSALLCGLAIEEHKKAIIFRREYPQIKSLIDDAAGFFCCPARLRAASSRSRYRARCWRASGSRAGNRPVSSLPAPSRKRP